MEADNYWIEVCVGVCMCVRRNWVYVIDWYGVDFIIETGVDFIM
jgi:hypothetical protein